MPGREHAGHDARIVAAGWVAGFLFAGLHHSGQRRATLTATAAGLVFGVSDALTRRTVEIVDAHPVTTLLTGWPFFCLVAASVAGFWLMESSFNAAPLHASLPAITPAEPVAGMLLGIVVFGDVIHPSPGMLALQAAGIAALVAGVILVARAGLQPAQPPGSAAAATRRSLTSPA